MTLKGKKRAIRNMVVALIAVLFIGGISSIVYSLTNSSIKIEFRGEVWTIKDGDFNKEWAADTIKDKLEFIVDLEDYYKKNQWSETENIFEIVETYSDSTITHKSVISPIMKTENINGVDTQIFTGKYQVELALDRANYEIDFQMIVLPNNYSIPETTAQNPSKSFKIVRDIIAPTVVFNGITDGAIGDFKSIDINPDEDSKLEINTYLVEGSNQSLINSDAQNYTNSYTYNLQKLTDGEYRIDVKASDRAGNETNNSITFQINTGAPNIQINGSGISAMYNKTDLEITAVDGNGIDFNNSVISITGPNGFSISNEKFDKNNGSEKNAIKLITLQDDGEYEVNIEVYDIHSTETKIQNYKITLDTKNAEIKVYHDNTLVHDGMSVNDKKILSKNHNREFEFSISDENGIKDRKLKITNDKGYLEEITTFNIGANNLESVVKNFSESKYSEGNYTVEIEVTDNSDNVASSTYEFVLDYKAPEIITTGLVDTTQNPKQHYNTDIDLTITATDDNLDKGSIKVTKDNGPEQIYNFSINGTSGSVNHKFSDEGMYSIIVESIDKAGNSSTQTYNFVIDKTAPEIIIPNYDTINNSYEKKNQNLDITIIEENYAENTVKITCNGTKNLIFNSNAITSQEVYSFTEDDEYAVKIEVKDAAGNNAVLKTSNNSAPIIDSVFEVKFKIDKNAPTIKVESVDKDNNYYEMKSGEIFDENHNKKVKVTIEDRFLTNNNVIKVTKDGQQYMPNNPLDFTLNGNIATLEHEFNEDGKYNMTIYAIDEIGNDTRHEDIDNKYKNFEFIVDTKGPEISIIDLGNDTSIDNFDKYYRTDLNLQFNINDANHDDNIITIVGKFEGKSIFGDEKELVIQNSDFSTNGNNKYYDYKFEKEGEYKVSIESTDKAGQSTKKEITFRIDKTPAEINVNKYNEINNAYIQNEEDIKFTVKEEFYNDYKIEVSYDKTTPDNSENNLKNHSLQVEEVSEKRGKEITYKISKDYFKEAAEYSLTFKVIEGCGQETKVDLVFTVDKVEPKVDILFDGQILSDDKLKEFNHYKSKKVNINTYDVNQKDNGNIIIVTRNDVEYNVGEFILEGRNANLEYNFTEEGDYKITAKSIDKSGRETIKTTRFIIDYTAPVIEISDYDNINNSFNNIEKSITVTVNEDNYVYDNVSVYYTKLLPDGTSSKYDLPFENISKSTTHTYSEFAEDGEYLLTVIATDKAGNVATTKSVKFTKDTVKPQLSIIGVDMDRHYNKDMYVSLLSKDVNQNENTYIITKDGETYLEGKLNISGREAVFNSTFTEEGIYEIKVYSKDKANNDNSTNIKFTIDKTKPVIKPLIKGENTEIKNGEYINKIFTPEFKLDESEDTIDIVTLNNGSNIAGAIPMASEEMVYNYKVVASDKASNETTLNITFTVDTTNPEVKVTGILDGYFSENMIPKYQITDTNLDESKTSALLNGKEFKSGTEISLQDYYNFKLLGTDLASNTTARNIVFTIDKDKPVIRFVEEMSGKYFTEDFIPNFVIEDLTDYTIVSMTLDGEYYEIGDEIVEEGKHVLYIEVKDKADNIESMSIEFILDKTPPKFIISGMKNKGVYYKPINVEIKLENPLDKIKSIEVNGELAKGDVKEENGQQVIKLNFSELNDYEVVLKAIDEAGNETLETIRFKIAEENIFVTMVSNKKILYPTVIVIVGVMSVVGYSLVRRRNIKINTNNPDTEE